jgi:hypothetical protein
MKDSGYVPPKKKCDCTVMGLSKLNSELFIKSKISLSVQMEAFIW